ncbi:hypothetical protein [Streptomyces sp. YS-3]|uniref:hypothetical protein n=1 Tax=Streptomyces sp. YS-3 TaxID=3381352 RepID=UPI0038628825
MPPNLAARELAASAPAHADDYSDFGDLAAYSALTPLSLLETVLHPNTIYDGKYTDS